MCHGTRTFRDERIGKTGQQLLPDGFVLLFEVEQWRNAGVELLLHISHPDCLKMAFDEIPVRQIESRGFDNTMNHCIGVVKKPLVVRAERRTIGKDKGGWTKRNAS